MVKMQYLIWVECGGGGDKNFFGATALLIAQQKFDKCFFFNFQF